MKTLITILLISICSLAQAQKKDTTKKEKPVYIHLSMDNKEQPCLTPRESFLNTANTTEQNFVSWVNGVRSNKAPKDTTYRIIDVRVVNAGKNIDLTFEQFIQYIWHACPTK